MKFRPCVVGLTMTGVVVACAPNQAASGDGDQTTVTVWSQQTQQAAVWEEIFSEFEESHPEIDVEFRAIEHSEYDSVLRTSMQGEGGPDVPFLRSYGGMQAFVSGGNLVALDEKVPGMADWGKATLDMARGDEDGKVYGVPYAIQTTQVFYNKEIFAEHDLNEPQTWGEFVDVYEALEDADVTPMAVGYRDASYLSHYFAIIAATQYGGEQFQQDLLSGETDYADPNYVKAVQFFADFAEDFFPEDAAGLGPEDAQAFFQSGEAAMHPAGTWELAAYKETPDLDVGLFSIPPGPGAVVDETLTPGYGDGSFGLNAKSDNKEAALELLQWMTTEEYGQLVLDVLVQPSAVPGLDAEDPVLAEALANYREHPTPFISYASFSGGSPDGQTIEQENLQKVLLGDLSAEQAATNIKEGIEQWFVPKN